MMYLHISSPWKLIKAEQFSVWAPLYLSISLLYSIRSIPRDLIHFFIIYLKPNLFKIFPFSRARKHLIRCLREYSCDPIRIGVWIFVVLRVKRRVGGEKSVCVGWERWRLYRKSQSRWWSLETDLYSGRRRFSRAIIFQAVRTSAWLAPSAWRSFE